MTTPGGMSLPADSLVIDNHVGQVSMAWPVPVDVRLEQILAQAKAAGERTSRRELVAALIATYEMTDDELSDMLRRYRKMKVREMLGVPDEANVVPFKKQPPGPRASERGPSR
jgi:hypothetical protein